MAYTTIDDPSAHFQIATYTGNGSSGHAITYNGNSDMQPDLLWFKNRDDTNNPTWLDSSRGVTNFLLTNSTQAEQSLSTLLSSFDTDGFTVNSNDNVNGNAEGIVSWGWKANGGTTSTNTDGTLTSTVQANTDAGFSIVTFTTDGTTKTVGHGLGVKPDIVLVKSRSTAGVWIFITDIVDGSMDYGVLNTTAAFSAIGYNPPTSSVFEYNDNNTYTQVAYCFAEKQGYSKFGKYTGNGSSNGPFVYTGFKPAWIMIKCSSSSTDGNWWIIDNKRDTYNVTKKTLEANTGNAEVTPYDRLDFLSNGFKNRVPGSNGWNVSGATYIYMAFAENPFVTSTGIPTTAR